MLPVHYKPRKISGVDKTDSKVAIVGRVVERGENSFVIEDDTGKTEIFFDSATASSVDKGKLVRVYCSVVDGRLSADIIQSMQGLDEKLFKKVEELYNKAGV